MQSKLTLLTMVVRLTASKVDVFPGCGGESGVVRCCSPRKRDVACACAGAGFGIHSHRFTAAIVNVKPFKFYAYF